MFVGIDIGTSGVKVAVVDESDHVAASASRHLEVSRPHANWSEQDPELWWRATENCLDELAAALPAALAAVRGIGLAGQMLGPVLLDSANNPLRPCILWNDGRAVAESEELVRRIPTIGQRAGCNPNPGFAAPKLLWLAKHEPDVLDRTDCLLLPKDFVRLRLTGERGTEPTDACGTHLMETATGTWAADLCEAAGFDMAKLPPIHAPYAPVGELLPHLSKRWGIPRGVPVAAGAGDNMAGAIGVGGGAPGDTVISVGTSAVICVVDATFNPIPDKAVITHQHAAPNTFLSMGVVLSATNCLSWAAGLLGLKAADLVARTEDAWQRNAIGEDTPIFLPFLSGVRTPHDRPQARGLMFGLGLETDVEKVGWSVLEGVAFQIRDALETQQAAGIAINRVQLVGGGARSELWSKLIATTTNLSLELPVGREIGAALGAARLARVAADDVDPTEILTAKPKAEMRVGADPMLGEFLAHRWERSRSLLKQTLDLL